MKHIFITSALSLFLISTVFSQSPGGVAGGGTNEMWFDATFLGLADWVKISSFTDKSGNGNHATQSTPSSQPYVTANDPNFNYRSSINFDGIDDVLRTASVSNLDVNTISMICVTKLTSSPSHSGIITRLAYTSGSSTAQKSNYMLSNYYDPSNYTFQLKKSDGTNLISSYTKPTGRVLSSMIWDGTTSLSTYNKGNLVSSVAGSDVIPSGNLGFALGGNFVGALFALQGSIAEVIVYSKALNTAERNIVENYLAAKYSIPIGNDFYAYNSSNSYDLIGVGMESDGSNTSANGQSLTINNPSALGTGDYLLLAHDNAGYIADEVDVPLSVGERYPQVWRAGVTGTPGTVDVAIDVSTNPLGSNNNSYELLVDANGIFAFGAISYPGVYVGGIVTFSNVSMADADYVTLYNSSSNSSISSTGVSTDWHTASTWDCNCIPTLSNDVIILGTHTVDINGQDANSRDLTITGTLTVSGSDVLNLNGNLVNNGTFTAGISSVKSVMATAQAFSGSSNLDFYDLILDNPTTITNSAIITIENQLDIKQGSLATSTSIRLISNASGTAALVNPKGGSFSGDITVERYINEADSTWYLLAPGVTDGNLEDWNQEFEMAGFTGTDWPGGSASVYYYDPTNNVSSFNDGYAVPINTTDVINEKTAWEAYIEDDGISTNPRTIDMTGTPALGNVNISLPYNSNIGDPASDGWNLVANPYAAPVLWGDVVKSGAWDEAQYKKTDGTNAVMSDAFVLASGEGFWAHVTAAGAALQFRRTFINKSDLTDTYNLRIANPFIKEESIMTLTLNEESTGHNDYCYVGFSDVATLNKDAQIDAYKLPQSNPSLPNLSTVMAGANLLKNVMNTTTDQIVPVRIFTTTPSNTVKNYSITFSNVKELLDYNKSILLEDKESNTFTELLDDTKIDFSRSDANDAPRFFLHISTPILFSAENVSCYGQSNGQVSASMKKTGNFDFVWKDESGNILQTSTNKSSSSLANLAPGNYTLEVDNFKQKFVITQPEEVKADFTALFGGISYGGQVSTQDNDTLLVNIGDLVSFESQSINQRNNTWDFGDLFSSSKENTSHIYFNSGVYKVSLTSLNTTCTATNIKYVRVDGSTSILETNLLNDIDVMVIENGVLVSLNNEDSKEVSFSIVNSIGQEVFSKEVNAEINHQERIKLDNAQGVYLISVKDSNGTKTKKIVLSKK